MSDLKPCPFCGREAIKNENVKYSPNETSYGCGNDECVCSEMSWATYNQWNTRPIEDALCNDIALLRSQKAGLEQTVNEQAIEIHQANAEIERLQSERRWIPVSERLPEENEDVLICDRCGEVTVCSRLEGYDGIVQFHIDSIVTHWMPLPEPPEEK